MNLGIAFAPLVPAYVVWTAFGVAWLISILLLVARSRGAPVRALAMAMMVLALANPSFTREDREPIPSVAAVIVDKSPSQDFGDRNKQTEAARAKRWSSGSSAFQGLEVRVVEAGAADGETDGTKLFSALVLDARRRAARPHRRRHHDHRRPRARHSGRTPRRSASPRRLHALITGHANEIDRRVVLTQTPRFGIVGPIADHHLPCRGSGRAGRRGGGHDSARRRGARANASSPCTPNQGQSRRSRMPAPISSRSKPRRSKTN